MYPAVFWLGVNVYFQVSGLFHFPSPQSISFVLCAGWTHRGELKKDSWGDALVGNWLTHFWTPRAVSLDSSLRERAFKPQ